MNNVIYIFKKYSFQKLVVLTLKTIKNNIVRNIAIKKYYTRNNVSYQSSLSPKTIIYMANRNVETGGLTDRLRAIVSLYKLCKEQTINFKINFVFPFRLSDYLCPNIHDWIIAEENISYDLKCAKPYYYVHLEEKTSSFVLKNCLKSIKKYNQLHFYTNASIADKEYHLLIKELFTPTKELQDLIDYHLKQIGCDFISAGFRFTGLLGDRGDTLNYESFFDDDGKSKLINRCVEHLNEIYLENNRQKIFVATDSAIFLEQIQHIPFIYTVHGKIARADGKVNTLHQDTLKLFLDYYLLAGSTKVITVKDGNMYLSGFHLHAALHNNIPYEIKKY
jgi:hypothetical protein